jgi:hypothetical protein
VDELQQTVKTGEKPLQDPVVTAPNEINNGTFKPAQKNNTNGKKYSKNRNHKNSGSTIPKREYQTRV